MTARKKSFVLLPLGAFVVAAGLFLLGYFGVVSVPWTPGAPAEALASESDSSSAAGDEKKSDEDEEEIIPVPVELARVEPKQISAYYRASSFIQADRHVELVSKTAGRVRKLNVEEGDWVAEGDILAELENDRERIQLRQAELRASDQQRDLTRRVSLLEKKLITQDEFDDSRSAYDLAEADRDLAQFTLEETLIRAPFDGQVTDRLIVPGQHISITEPMFTLVDLVPLRVRVSLPEVIARKIRPGQKVQVVTEAVDEPVNATVERIAPIVDPTTSTVRLTLLVEGDPKQLRVGGFVKVRITTDTHQEALAIPKKALVEEGGLRSVFVAEADTVRKIEVRTGLYDESHVEILDGLEASEFVISIGQGGLRTGSHVKVLNADDVGWVSPSDAASESEGEEIEGSDESSQSETEPGDPDADE
jgi:RND family efflux transporter MFP subunit